MASAYSPPRAACCAPATSRPARAFPTGSAGLPAQPSPIPAPNFAPRLTVVSVDGRLVKVRLSDPANPTRGRIPGGVNGAIVMSHVGPTAPSDPSAYRMEGPTSRTSVDILFPESVAPGTQVWLTAVWFNERKQMGPACSPVGTHINYGGSMPMAA